MATNTFRFRVPCSGECGKTLTTVLIGLQDGEDGPELPIEAIGKVHAYCAEDHLFVSLLAPDVKSDLVEVDE